MTCKLAGTGLGAKGQGIAAPVQPVSLDGSSGLGFQMPPPMFERRPLLRRRSSPPRRSQTAALTAVHFTLPCIKADSVEAAVLLGGQLIVGSPVQLGYNSRHDCSFMFMFKWCLFR